MIMSNLRIKNKKLKREIERLKDLRFSVANSLCFSRSENSPITLRANISLDGYEFDKLSTEDLSIIEDYIRRKLIDEIKEELIKYITVESHRDIYSDRVVCSGEVTIINRRED